MVEKRVLSNAMPVELALPKEGFSHSFISDISSACEKFQPLKEGFVLLKKSEDEVSLLFCFLFEEGQQSAAEDAVIEALAESILGLLDGNMAIDIVSLNGKERLAESVRSVTSPFFRRDITG